MLVVGGSSLVDVCCELLVCSLVVDCSWLCVVCLSVLLFVRCWLLFDVCCWLMCLCCVCVLWYDVSCSSLLFAVLRCLMMVVRCLCVGCHSLFMVGCSWLVVGCCLLIVV